MKILPTLEMEVRNLMSDRITEGIANILRGWDASDLTTHDSADWDVISWKRFHATAYRYQVEPVFAEPVAAGERPRIAGGRCLVTLTLATDTDRKVYVSDKFGPFIQTMREAMFDLVEVYAEEIVGEVPSSKPMTASGIVYIALSGLPGTRRRWTIPLYAPGVR